MTPEPEEKKSHTFYLRCTKKGCSFKFAIERPSADMNKVDITKMKCLECQSDVMWDDSNFPGSALKRSAAAKANAAMTATAMEMAHRQRGIDKQENPMVTVTSTQKGKNFGKQMEIPKKVIESIEEKVAEIEES